MQQRRLDGRIGGDEAEHRRHVGADHAGALADAGDGHRAPAELDLHGRDLRHRVGGHDRLGGRGPAIAGGVGDRGG